MGNKSKNKADKHQKALEKIHGKKKKLRILKGIKQFIKFITG